MAPKSNAQIQADYRARHLKSDGATSARLDMLVDQSAKLALQRLAAHQGVTMREMLQSLAMAAQSTLLATLDADQQGRFYDAVKITR